jgi:hypothetical protein
MIVEYVKPHPSRGINQKIKSMKSVMFVGALLLMSFGCNKELIEPEAEMESLETPESIEDHILRCEYGEDCMFL